GLDNLKDLPSQDEIKELFSDIKTEERETLESVSETLLSKKGSDINYEKDEKENKRIKDVLKSLPSSVEFLNEEKKPEKTEEKSKIETTRPFK
ncbi:MAG: hypothetical protein OXC37_02255, partial [Bdellovibrionaceae bacterium]|nr:hypothetical protein [Pseudobdellovibrionaceae bacterium]